MPVGNGGIIGPNNTPSTSSAKGVWSIREAMLAQRAGNWPIVQVSDPYFEYTTLLLPGNGTNGAQNNTFLDSSTNAFSITRNGNTTQGTFSPFSQTGWGNYFDGSGDYLSGPTNNATATFTGDFTIESWCYFNSIAADCTVAACIEAGPPELGWLFRWRQAGLAFRFVSTALGSFDFSYTPAVGTWFHVALTRSGSSLRCFINGTQIGTTQTMSGTVTRSTTNPLTVGGGPYAAASTNGYLSNVRIVNGTAVYTADFTPSTTPLTAITNTSLLTCQSNRFIDNSSNAFAITRNGDVSVQAFSPFNPTAAWSASTNGGSGYFDGSGDYLVAPDNAALEPGSSNLTWEMWINTTSSTQYATLYSRTTASFASGMWSLMINLASSTAGDVGLYVADYSTGGPLLQTTGVNVRDNAWHHIAVVRNGSSWVLYVDGVSRATNTWAGTIADIAGGPYVGRDQFYGRDYIGYMADLRIVKGTAVYTAAFTPPTAPLTAITNTSLLLNFTNAGIYDATSKNDLETVGNAQISTTQSKFGGSSMYFDGTGDWLQIPNGQNFAFGAGDWTVELWVRPASSSRQGFATLGNSAGTNIPWEVGINASGKFRALVQTSGGQVVIDGTTTPASNTWYHIAVARYGGTVTLYVNGIAEATGSVSTNALVTETSPVFVGTYYYGFPLTGYINDLRITKGYARYTSNFTPPTAEFQLL